MEEFFFKGIWRMDWGLGNPNKTAALIVALMVGLWGLASIRKWGFWVALVGFAGLGVCLVHTFSRGGIVALFLGLLPVLWFAPHPWGWRRILGVGIAVWGIIGFSVYLQAHNRLDPDFVRQDRSITNRFELWKAAPAMMLDAPWGWGLGNSGKAFVEWYQPLDRNEPYRTMVNSHLTWLVEFGWPMRFVYLAGWLLVLLLCLPGPRSRWLSVPLGVWLSFLISATFSSVAEEPWVWSVPVLFLLLALGWRIRASIWPRPVLWLGPPVVAALALLLIPLGWQKSNIRHLPGATIVGKRVPETWVVADDQVLGARHGRTLRNFGETLGDTTIGIVQDMADLPGDLSGSTLVLSGNFVSAPSPVIGDRLAGARAVIIVNPGIFPQELGDLSDVRDKLTVVIGDFAQTPAVHSWSGQFETRSLAGVGDFVPDWPARLLPRFQAP